MRLSDHLTIRLSGIFILILLLWSVIYFIIQMTEIHDGIDEGLNNLKQEFVYKANNSDGFIEAMQEHNPLNIIVEKISYEDAVEFKEIYSDSKVYFVTEEEDEEVRMLTTAFYCEKDKQYYRLKFFTSTIERDDLVKNMLYLLIALWVSLALAIVLAIKITIHRSNKPFYRLLENLRDFELNNFRMIEFPGTKISEYKELNASIKSLLEENIRVFTEQKNFIENASHELQTPLTIATGKLENMLNDEELDQSQMEEINSVLNSLSRMKRLNSSLLLLSKIRNKQFITDEAIDLNHTLTEILENFQPLADHKNITVHREAKSNLQPIKINKDLAYILLNNLVKNAIFHNTQGGDINITTSEFSITITNDGPKIDNAIDMFERYKSGTSESQSFGLGLSIVRSIVDLYKFNIAYKYDNKHIIILRFR